MSQLFAVFSLAAAGAPPSGLGNVSGVAGTISIAGDSILNVHDLTLTGAAFDSATIASGTGVINVDGNLLVDTNGGFSDAAGVATVVAGTTTIGGSDPSASNTTYFAAGNNNIYKGGIEVTNKGVLSNTAGDTAIVSAGNNGDGAVTLAGGRLAAAAGGIIVKAGSLHVTGDGSGIDASGGAIDLSAAAVSLNGGTRINASNAITMKSLALTTGYSTITGDNLVVEGVTVIGGGDNDAMLGADSTTSGGLLKGGVVVATKGYLDSGTYTVGEGTSGNDIVLNGGWLDGSAHVNGALTLIDGTAAAGGANLTVSGPDSRVLGEVNAADYNVVVLLSEINDETLQIDQSTGDGFKVRSISIYGEVVMGLWDAVASQGIMTVSNGVKVENAGYLEAGNNGAGTNAVIRSINPVPSQSIFFVADGGAVAADRASLEITGFGEVRIDGYLVAGHNGTNANRLTADSAINFGSSATVGLPPSSSSTDKLAMWWRRPPAPIPPSPG